MKGPARRLVSDKRGVTSVEYAMIAGVIIIAIVVGVTSIGSSVSGIFSKANSPFAATR